MNPTPFSSKVKIYTFSAIALMFIAVLLRSFNFVFLFDPTVDYFKASPLHTGYLILCILSVGWFLSAVFFIPRHAFSVRTAPSSSLASRTAALICVCASVASFFFFRENMIFYFEHLRLYQLLAIFSLLSTVYFGFQAIRDVAASYRALAGYIAILWCGLMLCATYLNLYVAMNSPFKVTFHMALLAFMLYLAEEARLLTNHGFRIAYFAYLLIALFNCSVASFPVFIAYAFQKYHQIDYLFYAVLSLFFCAYLAARLYDCYRLLMTAAPSTAEEIAQETQKQTSAQKTSKEEGDDQHVS